MCCGEGPSIRPARGRLRRFALTLAAFTVLIPSAGCNDDEDDDTGGSTLIISFSVIPPAGGTMNVIHFEEAAAGADLLQVDVLARDVTTPFDGYNIEITFDPMTAEAFGLTPGTFLDQCSGLQSLKADNVSNGNANATGKIVFGASLPGGSPPGCTVTGTARLARLTLRARNPGDFPPHFVAYNGDPNIPSGSRLFRTNPPVPAIPLTFDDGQAEVNVN